MVVFYADLVNFKYFTTPYAAIRPVAKHAVSK